MAPADRLSLCASFRSASQGRNGIITGTVNAYREAIIRVVVGGPGGREQEIECIVDTGLSGSLSLPPALVAEHGLPFRRRDRALLADGSFESGTFRLLEKSAAKLVDGQHVRLTVETEGTLPPAFTVPLGLTSDNSTQGD